MNEKLQEIIDFFGQRNGWSDSELIAGYIAEVEELKGYAPDEVGLQRDDDKIIMILWDFAEMFFNKTIDGICNVLQSYKENEE